METDFKQFLKTHNFLPLDNGIWQKITVDHSSDEMPSKIKKQIREQLNGYTSGIYVYTNQKGDVYYVGQGKLKSRIIKKYEQSIKNYYTVGIQTNKVPTSRYYFFRSKREKLNVYVINIEGYMEQIAIEAMLSSVLKPKYLDFLKEYNELKKKGLLVQKLQQIQHSC